MIGVFRRLFHFGFSRPLALVGRTFLRLLASNHLKDFVRGRCPEEPESHRAPAPRIFSHGENLRMSLKDPSDKSSTPPTEHHARKRPVSERKIQANRNNALRSTGPKTERGKRIVSRNAIKHGFLVREVVITAGDGAENQEEFHALIESLWNCYEPVGIVEETQVHLNRYNPLEESACHSCRKRRNTQAAGHDLGGPSPAKFGQNQSCFGGIPIERFLQT